jgi:hypothetical protein
VPLSPSLEDPLPKSQLDLFALASAFIEVPVSSWRSAPWWFIRLCIAVLLSCVSVVAFALAPGQREPGLTMFVGAGVACAVATVILLLTLLTADAYTKVTRFARKVRHWISGAMWGLSVFFVAVLALGAVAAGMTPRVSSDPQVLLLLTTTAIMAAFWGWMALMMTPPFLSTAPTIDLHQAGRAFSAMTAAAVVLVAYTCWFLHPQIEVGGSISVALVAVAACVAGRGRAVARLEQRRQQLLEMLDEGITARSDVTDDGPSPLVSALLRLQSLSSPSPFAQSPFLDAPASVAWEVRMMLEFLISENGEAPFPSDLERRRAQLAAWNDLDEVAKAAAVRNLLRALRSRLVSPPRSSV